MVNHPNRNWRNKWAIDLSTCTATYRDGVVVRFVQDADDLSAWNGEIVEGLPILSTDINTAQKQANKIAQLMRQAGEIYKEYLDKRQ